MSILSVRFPLITSSRVCGIAASRFCFINCFVGACKAKQNTYVMSSEDILVIVVLIVIFYLCRELNCWYFKINDRKKQMDQMIENQQEIINLLKKLNHAEQENSSPEA